MSCLGFLSPQQRALLRASTADGPPLSSFASPALTDGKRQRLRQMSISEDPKIRESAALAHGTPAEVLDELSSDADLGVRCSVARNERTPPTTLTILATDPVAGVRAWVAANPSVPPEVLVVLLTDDDPTVRDVATWAGRWPDAR